MSLQCQIYIIQDYFMLSGCLVARSHAVQCSYSRTGAQHFIPRMDRVVFQFTEVGTLPGTGGAVVRPSYAMSVVVCMTLDRGRARARGEP